MNQPRIYLDTSVISHLKADDTPEKMHDTIKFWEEIKKYGYSIILSDVTIEELSHCPEPKRSFLFHFLSQIDHMVLEETEESVNLARDYVKFGVLPQKCFDDCRHIALAALAECDYIASWNFKHFVNIKTINRIQAVNKLLGYKEVLILPPSMIMEGDDD